MGGPYVIVPFMSQALALWFRLPHHKTCWFARRKFVVVCRL